MRIAIDVILLSKQMSNRQKFDDKKIDDISGFIMGISGEAKANARAQFGYRSIIQVEPNCINHADYNMLNPK